MMLQVWGSANISACWLSFTQLQEIRHTAFHKLLVLQLSEQVTPSLNLGFYFYQIGLIIPISLAAFKIKQDG